MKTIINYFKKRQEKRLRTKIALRTCYTVNDLQTVYKFIEGKDPDKQQFQLGENRGKAKFVDGAFSCKAKINIDSILDDYFKRKEASALKVGKLIDVEEFRIKKQDESAIGAS